MFKSKMDENSKSHKKCKDKNKVFYAIKEIPQDEVDVFTVRYKEYNSREAKKSKPYFWLTYHILASNVTKPRFPIAIHTLLPSFDFIIGNPVSEDGFKLNVMYDLGVALTIKYSVSHPKVAKNTCFSSRLVGSLGTIIIAQSVYVVL